MTVASTLPAGGHVTRVGASMVAAVSAREEHSFAERLLERVEQGLVEGNGYRPSFDAGMMRPDAEGFGAHGMLDLGAGGSTTLKDVAPEDTTSGGRLAIESATSQADRVDRLPVPVIETSPTSNQQAAKTSTGPLGRENPSSRVFFEHAPLTAAKPIASPDLPTSIVTGSVEDEEIPVCGTGTRRPAELSPLRSASALRVELNVGQSGATVMVNGECLDPEELGSLRQSVGRLLARHGLVLSELRITPRMSGERQQEGE